MGCHRFHHAITLKNERAGENTFRSLHFSRLWRSVLSQKEKKLFLESEQLEGSLLRGETGWSGPGGAALWAPGLVTAGQEEPKATSSSFTGNSQASGRAFLFLSLTLYLESLQTYRKVAKIARDRSP